MTASKTQLKKKRYSALLAITLIGFINPPMKGGCLWSGTALILILSIFFFINSSLVLSASKYHTVDLSSTLIRPEIPGQFKWWSTGALTDKWKFPLFGIDNQCKVNENWSLTWTVTFVGLTKILAELFNLQKSIPPSQHSQMLRKPKIIIIDYIYSKYLLWHQVFATNVYWRYLKTNLTMIVARIRALCFDTFNIVHNELCFHWNLSLHHKLLSIRKLLLRRRSLFL